MKKSKIATIFKKSILLLFLATAVFYASSFFDFSQATAINYQESSAWVGQDIGVSPLENVNYVSVYEPYETISNNPGAIDTNKIYVIETALDLYQLSVDAKGSYQSDYLSLDYVLGNDIDYFDALKISMNNLFIPIGFQQPFTGTFDGQGYEITNLIFRSVNTENAYNQYMSGLIYYSMFSMTSPTAVIKNFGLINPLIVQALDLGLMTHVSTFVGLNEGLLENVYYIDTREASAGINAEGDFIISGLVSVNQGTVSNSYIASPYVKSQSVTQNLTSALMMYQNTGNVDHLYYDQDILLDTDSSSLYATPLHTQDFQNPSIFTTTWYFQDSYVDLSNDPYQAAQLTIDKTYPILQGLEVINQSLYITDATDLIYMNHLLTLSGFFRSSTYILNADIDMRQVSRDAFVAAEVSFDGIFTSNVISGNTLYNHQGLGGSEDHYSIINLTISQASFVGDYASYALFSALFGQISSINFIQMTIMTADINLIQNVDRIFVSSIAGASNESYIYDVHVDVDVILTVDQESLGNLFVSGLISYGSSSIFQSTATGDIENIYVNDNERMTSNYIAGIISFATHLTLDHVISDIDIHGLSYQNTPTNTTYYGGVVGFGNIEFMDKVINTGNILTQVSGLVDQIYVGGIIAYQNDLVQSISYIYQNGDIDVKMFGPSNVYVAGYGYVTDQENDIDILSVSNHGEITLTPQASLSETILNQIDVYLSFGLITYEANGSIKGVFNLSYQNLDLSFIDYFAANVLALSQTNLTIEQSYQSGDIDFYTSQTLVNQNIYLSFNVYGTHLSLNHLRQENDISIYMNHNTSSALSNAKLFINGLFLEASEGFYVTNGYQGGDISIEKDAANHIAYDLYVSGMGYANRNQDIYTDLEIDPLSIDINSVDGTVDTMLNSGNILVNGNFDGHVKVAGIILYNESILTNAINLGNIEVYNDAQTANDQMEAAGIVYALISEYAQIRDAANNGDIKVASNSTLGYAHAAGIAVRNDKLENGNDISTGSSHQFSKIMFSINYGDIYAYNLTSESSYSITNETRSKAAGILGLGILSVVNNINYGNIYSRYLAAGIFGFMYYSKFDKINPDEVYVSNLINYGKIRQVTSYDPSTHAYTYSMSTTPPQTLPYAFGAVVGKIHTGTTTWAFAGNTQYPIDSIYFGYLLNFDAKINMFASAPPLSSNWQSIFNGSIDDANTVLVNMVQYMATTNPSDDSVEPFTYFYTGSGWVGSYIGQVIKYYDVSETDDGMFYELFPFRSPRPANAGTDQYIKDYIEYIPASKVNDSILNKLEADTTYDFPGIYALSSSLGINNGIFIPDNFDLSGLDPYDLDSAVADTSWIGDASTQSTVAYQLYSEMRQIKVSFATTIYNLDIVQTDVNGNVLASGLTLSNPVIDQERKMLTYYLPSNAAVLGTQSYQQLTVSRYIEVEDSYVTGARRVANLLTGDNALDGYTWVGTHKKVGDQMVEIGPYATTGRYNLTTYDSQPYDSSSRNTPVYDLTWATDAVDATNQVFTHEPHVKTTFLWWTFWDATGYRVNRTTANYGYGAYEAFSLSGYPTLYQYVGPSTEPVTYVLSANQSGVFVYPESGVYFKADTQDGSYTISDTASLQYNGTDDTSLITIPRSYGVYDSMYDSQGTYVDSVEDHYGSVRVYSQEYNQADTSTYQDYEIRIIRTANEDITDINSLLVNGVASLPQYYNVNNLTSLNDLSYDTTGQNGIIRISYETYNVSNQFQLLPYIEVFDNNTGVKVYTSLYKLSQGEVITLNDFNNDTGQWGYGEATVVFEANEDFASGDYYIELTLLSGEIFRIHFSKQESANADVLQMTYQDEIIDISSNSYTSYIDYGMYYLSEQAATHVVNFTNLSSISHVYYDEVANELPSYLDGLVISNFAEISYVTFAVSLVDGYRHQYTIAYHLTAENGSTNIFTHYIIESALSQDPSAVYKNGGSLNLPVTNVNVLYQESPTIRVEYDFLNTYFATEDILTIDSSFTPLVAGEDALEGIDYFTNPISDIGYEIDLNQSTAKGSYFYQLSYDQVASVNGQTLTWHYTFNELQVTKLRNDNSHLKNVLFASDSVFDEVLDAFVTIIDIDEVTPTQYLAYFDEENPTTRIISVLPTSGIDYGTYESYQSYWIIGQVQETDLTAYMPTFYIPDGSSIYRVTDEANIDFTYQSTNLSADFTDFGTGESLNYIHYRIYAEDYNDYPTHYTDYYIAVQDATNNIKFDITVENDTQDLIEQVFVKVNIYQYASDFQGEMQYDDILVSMGLFSYYNQSSDSYDNNQFETSMYGFYVVYVDLPEGYSFEVEFEQSYIQDLVYLESSRIPRRYYVTIHIIEETPNSPSWGYQALFYYEAPAEALDINHTYTDGDRFTYDGTTWIVISSSYTYDSNNPPGTGAWQGLQDASGIYSSVSTYEIGDVVYYIDRYYVAIASYASYNNPISGLGDSWNEVSENWLSYNLYTTGDIVLYNGTYYISTASWNKGYQPDITTWAWQIYS